MKYLFIYNMEKYIILLLLLLIIYVLCFDNNTIENFSTQLKTGSFIVGDGSAFTQGLRVESDATIARNLNILGNTNASTNLTARRTAIGGVGTAEADLLRVGPSNTDFLFYNTQGQLGRASGQTLNIVSNINATGALAVGGASTFNGTTSLGATTFRDGSTASLANATVRSDLTVNRNLTTNGTSSLGNTNVRNNLTVNETTSLGDTTFRDNNQITINGQTNFRGATNGNPTNMRTHFPNNDGFNYIRGSTNLLGNLTVDGQLNVNGRGRINNYSVQFDDSRGNTIRTPDFYRQRGTGSYNEFSLERQTGGPNNDGWVNVHTQVFYWDNTAPNSIIQHIYTPNGVFVRESISATEWGPRRQIGIHGDSSFEIIKRNVDFTQGSTAETGTPVGNITNIGDCINRCRNNNNNAVPVVAVHSKATNTCWCKTEIAGGRKNNNFDSAILL